MSFTGIILWFLLLVICWPLAVLLLILLPLIWLLLLPFKLVGLTVEAIIKLIGAVLMLPFKVLKAI